ncbi:MAG: hypothetical protein KDI79_24345 [Anaerolineae bacterium]|nr:hypothetical protein [Anaerolineae bacterium]
MHNPIKQQRLTFGVIILSSIIVVAALYAGKTFFQSQQQREIETRAVASTVSAEMIANHYEKGIAYTNIGRWNEAKKELELVFETDPNYKDVQQQLIRVYDGPLTEAQIQTLYQEVKLPSSK